MLETPFVSRLLNQARETVNAPRSLSWQTPQQPQTGVWMLPEGQSKAQRGLLVMLEQKSLTYRVTEAAGRGRGKQEEELSSYF